MLNLIIFSPPYLQEIIRMLILSNMEGKAQRKKEGKELLLIPSSSKMNKRDTVFVCLRSNGR